MIRDPKTQREGFAVLVSQYGEPLYWKVRHIVLDHDDADDVLQNAFVKAWTNLDSFQGKSSLSTWLYRIAINEALDFLRRKNGRAASGPKHPYGRRIFLKIKSVLPEWHSARSCHSASAAGYRHPAQHSRWRRSGVKMPSGRHRTERRTGPHTRSDSARCKGATA